MIYIIDHNDSFTYNVVHQFSLFDKVYCDNYNQIDKTKLRQASVIVFSPGPGNPKNYPSTTKIYEEFIRKEVDQLETFDKELKGEITIVISEKNENKKNSQKLSESDKRNINKMINKLSIKEITNFISSSSKISKKEIYNYCLMLKNDK